MRSTPPERTRAEDDAHDDATYQWGEMTAAQRVAIADADILDFIKYLEEEIRALAIAQKAVPHIASLSQRSFEYRRMLVTIDRWMVTLPFAQEWIANRAAALLGPDEETP